MAARAWLQAPSAILLLSLGACAGWPPAIERGAPSRAREPPHRVAPRRPGGSSRSFRAELTAQGATVVPARGGAWAFHATPLGFGCDGALDGLGAAAPATRRGRVEYGRHGLREWYVEGPRGLEHRRHEESRRRRHTPKACPAQALTRS